MIRSILFQAAYYLLSVGYVLLCVLASIIPGSNVTTWMVQRYAKRMVQAMRWIAGIKVTMVSQDKLPKGAFILAPKHQSWGDGFCAFSTVDDLVFVTGNHLEKIPLLKGVLNKIGAILASVMWAIPAPDYDVKIVYKDREVEKRVPVPIYKGVKEVPSTYQNVYDKCIESANVRADGELIKQCHQQAREASTPAQSVKVVYKPSPYKDLFDQCNDGWTGSISDMKDPVTTFKARQARMTFCQGYAAQGATIH